ncbi:MAG: type II 3-dehydroquinate dehydratase [Chitinophagales bacterium]
MPQSILILNGPNLNLLGKREPHIYGHETLADVNEKCIELGKKLEVEVVCEQANGEGALIDLIHLARTTKAAIVINPGGYTHTSVALRDALVASDLPVFEVHISNVHKREAFRHFSYISGIAVGVICGLGTLGYQLALRAAVDYLQAREVGSEMRDER